MNGKFCGISARSGARSKYGFDSKRIVKLAFMTATALIVSLIESLFPTPILLAPGAKLGLSNIAPLMTLIISGVADAFIVMTLKCLLGALITGGLSGLMYSILSGIVSLAVEVLLFEITFDKTSIAMISLIGAVVFNIVQLAVACAVTGVNLIALLPWLMLAGFAAGGFTGLLTYYIVKKLPYAVYQVRRSRS